MLGAASEVSLLDGVLDHVGDEGIHGCLLLWLDVLGFLDRRLRSS